MSVSQRQFKLRTARAVALSTTIILTMMAPSAMAQDTLTWDAGDGGAGTPLGADGDWIQGGPTRLWQDVPNGQFN
ncbi:MAG: hypothetical protein AAF214_12205, partial [Pseudomonadota bacterium]